MKYNFKEYENMVVQFNFHYYKWLIVYFPVLLSVIVFVRLTILDDDYVVNFISAGVGYFISNTILKKAISGNSKKVNRTKKIVCIENILDEDKIIQKVYQENNVETYSEYYYKDIIKVKDDKHNFYLYITNKAVIIVNKQKLENIEWFKQLIKEKCVMIKK